MFCPRCGSEIKNNQKFCINCGYDLSEDVKELSNKNSIYKKSYYKEEKKSNINVDFNYIFNLIFKIIFALILLFVGLIGLKFVSHYISNNNFNTDKSKYELYMEDPSSIPELVQPESVQDLVKNLKDVQNFLVLYLKYSQDTTEQKAKVFDNYRQQLLKIETFSNENLLKEDIKNSTPQTKKEFNKCASYYNKELAPVGLKIVSDTAYAKYYLKEDYRFTYKKFGQYVSSDMKAYLYLRAKHKDEFLENGGYLATTPKEMNKRISDYEKFLINNPNFEKINEVKDYLYVYTFGYIFVNDRQEMKAIRHNTFRKWDKKYIRQNKNSKLNPIFSKMVTSANGISSNQFDNLYPYEYEKMLESIRPINGELDDIFIDLRKELIKDISSVGYKYVYSQTEGMWTPFNDATKISKDSLLVANNEQGGFDVYNNKFKKTNQVINIQNNEQVILKRGQLLVYNPQCLQISKIDYSYGNFSVKVLSSKEIRTYFPDVLIINVDNIGNSPVQVTKDKEKQSYMLISHAGSNFDGYILHSDIPIGQEELSNMFSINTIETVNVEWIPATGDGKQYFISFITNIKENTIQPNNNQNIQDNSTNNTNNSNNQ